MEQNPGRQFLLSVSVALSVCFYLSAVVCMVHPDSGGSEIYDNINPGFDHGFIFQPVSHQALPETDHCINRSHLSADGYLHTSITVQGEISMKYTTQLATKFAFGTLLIFLVLTFNVSAGSRDHKQIIQIDPDLTS